jgi:hypothetical protein
LMELLADQLFLGITSWRLCFPTSPFIVVDARWSRLSSLENTRRVADKPLFCDTVATV